MPDRGALRGLAVAFPTERRPNTWWTEHHPETVQGPGDPFRGAHVRRVLAPGEGAVDLEERAAHRVLSVTGTPVDAVDLCLVSALRPDTHVIGDGAELARRLGLRAPALALESGDSSALAAANLASDLVASGRYRAVLCVSACTFTRDVPPWTPMGRWVGDGAGALLFTPARDEEGVLGHHAVPTAESCGALGYVETEAGLSLALLDDRLAHRFSELGRRWLQATVRHALARAGVTLDEVRWVVPNTPTAGAATYVAEVLGIDPERVVDVHPHTANCGPALTAAGLYCVAEALAPGDLVLLYAAGWSATATATVIRWGDVAIGPSATNRETAGMSIA